MINNLKYETMSIYELRTYARQCGVNSPTTKKKTELIDLIKKIKAGEELPFVSTKGRPPLMKMSNSYQSLFLRLSDNSIIEPIIDAYDFKDFLIIMENVIKDSFNVIIEKINEEFYKLIFNDDIIFIKIYNI